jgi:3-oxoacyl-[acyl-carrier-protein] synthase II
LAFGIKGPGTTQLDRENACFAALDEASWWLHGDLVDAVLLLGTDGLFPLLTDLMRGSRLSARQGDPQPGQATGLLPGEGAQAFLLERASTAEARGARVRARLRALAGASEPTDGPHHRQTAMAIAVGEALGDCRPSTWIAGANGHPRLDLAELGLAAAFPHLPAPGHPKALWGELGGSGGQLLAAALLGAPGPVLITAPASFGTQFAALVETL